MQIKFLSIKNWRQFDDLSIEFHSKVTIITGPNGAGKTTVLNMLSRTMGWSVALLTVPQPDQRQIESEVSSLNLPFDNSEPSSGFIVLSDDSKIDLGLSQGRNISQIYNAIGSVNGVYITSHRQQFQYSKINSIPAKFDALDSILDGYISKYKMSYGNQREQEIVKLENSPTYRIKSSLISMAVFGEGNSVVAPNPEALDTFRGFEQVLRVVLPEEIGFERFYIKMPELLIVGRGGVYPFESLSGGAAAIVDLAWQVFLASKIFTEFLVMIDEPENHLHPSLQKRLLPGLIAAFPSAQFVIATHSPLMINSVESSNIFVVRQSRAGKFYAQILDMLNKGSSSQDILYDVLGVDGSTPSWAETRLSEIIEKYEGRGSDRFALKDMTQELKASGLADRMASAFSKIIERSNDQTD